ncbi:MAG: hypothetical protein CME62_15675 [Halobacteriovoraceae bacterium]|nr:hypothetical protein [Halobacteriovoraceae bacterium]|tara:strand:- start:5310 stop:6014 length:705 start_codon:yes stop_codon:yes gene_type:complete
MKNLKLIALLFVLFSFTAKATVWIMIGDPSENKIGAIGMSSGHIGKKTFALADNTGMVGIGSWYVSRAQRRLSPILYQSLGSWDMLNAISAEANRKRGSYYRRVTLIRSNFYTGSLASDGCHGENYYCGESTGEHFAITGGGLTGPEVINNTRDLIEFNKTRNLPLECQLMQAMRKLHDTGGEWKLFERLVFAVDDLNLYNDADMKIFYRKGRHENDLFSDLQRYLAKRDVYCN